MRILLAGCNVDRESLEKLSLPAGVPLTPETLSAAYARISRSPKDITTLRREAVVDVIKARKSNQRIIFTMGHHSVAEHAVFNFDIMDVSRVALEEIEKFRLVSYTEKSQRYVTLDGDYVLPEEIREPGLKKRFRETIRQQNDFYRRALAILEAQNSAGRNGRAASAASKRESENLAKEDARYILSLATQGQVGMTINARNLEHLFRRTALSPYAEVRQIGQNMFRLAEAITPSLILFPRPSRFEQQLRAERPNILSWPGKKAQTCFATAKPWVAVEENGDDKILAVLLAATNDLPLAETQRQVRRWSAKKKRTIFGKLFAAMEFFDSPPREFEWAHVEFQAVVSAACYAQLKRHRLGTLLAGDYAQNLGNTIPASISRAGLEKKFRALIADSNRLYRLLRPKYGPVADYVLTNSHRRLVLAKFNLRELYHFVRLRDDEHAQWDIRRLAGQIAAATQKKMPLASLLLCGKSQFGQTYEKLYGHQPEFSL